MYLALYIIAGIATFFLILAGSIPHHDLPVAKSGAVWTLLLLSASTALLGRFFQLLREIRDGVQD